MSVTKPRDWLAHWWHETNNPIYVLALVANWPNDVPLPAWVRDYLRGAAQNSVSQAGASPDNAKKLVGEAFGLYRSKTKNAFARRANDAVAQQAALHVARGECDAVEAVKAASGRYVGARHAAQILARGRRLNHCPGSGAERPEMQHEVSRLDRSGQWVIEFIGPVDAPNGALTPFRGPVFRVRSIGGLPPAIGRIWCCSIDRVCWAFGG